jgi:FkbM family methyltransferase
MLKNMISGYLRRNAGSMRMQKLYQKLHGVALTGMNYGRGGTYTESGEMNVLELVRDRYRKNDRITIFDVGANVGEYARTMAQLFGEKAQIHSFEPSVKCFQTFSKTTDGLRTIKANNFGLSDAATNVTLYSDASDSGLASLYNRKLDHYGIDMNMTEEISLSTLDEYCVENAIDRIHFLKLDIEGHELSALKGAARMLKEDRIDVIQFEFGGCNIDSRTFFQDFFYLLNDKYKIHRIVRDGIVEIPQYSELHEVFITINYLAIHR